MKPKTNGSTGQVESKNGSSLARYGTALVAAILTGVIVGVVGGLLHVNLPPVTEAIMAILLILVGIIVGQILAHGSHG